MGAFKEAARRRVAESLPRGRSGGGGQARLARAQVLGPHRAPALRPRAAAERRLLAARGLHGPGRLRARAAPTCGSPTAPSGPCRSRSTSPRPSPTASSSARPIALRDREGVLLATLTRRGDRWQPDKRAEAVRRVRHRRQGASGACATCIDARRRRLSRRPARRASSRRRTTTSSICATRPQELRDRFEQAGLAPGRRLPDPQPDAPRAPGADLARRPGGRGQPADPSGRRHDQARRRRPLHPRPLLRAAARATIPSRRRR